MIASASWGPSRQHMRLLGDISHPNHNVCVNWIHCGLVLQSVWSTLHRLPPSTSAIGMNCRLWNRNSAYSSWQWNSICSNGQNTMDPALQLCGLTIWMSSVNATREWGSVYTTDETWTWLYELHDFGLYFNSLFSRWGYMYIFSLPLYLHCLLFLSTIHLDTMLFYMCQLLSVSFHTLSHLSLAKILEANISMTFYMFENWDSDKSEAFKVT
jgi:hypothetical protein